MQPEVDCDLEEGGGMSLVAPFPYFGGKRRAVPKIKWS